MAYANSYTYIYGFGLMDDLHNFFPEILYDDTLFPEQRFGWFRHRVSTLFPSVFPRQMNMYNIYNAAERQHMFNTWVQSQTIGIQTPPSTSVSSTANTTANTTASTLRPVATIRYTTAANEHFAHARQASPQAASPQHAPPQHAPPQHAPPQHAPPQQAAAANILMHMSPAPQTPQRPPPQVIPSAPQRRVAHARASDVDIITALFTLPTNAPASASPLTTPLSSLFGANEILSLLTNNLNFQDVPVIPTLRQIESASRVIQHADIPDDENCAICQEHSVTGQEQSAWRRLHCSHQFHTGCIMPWFQRNVHCPVCRADIRELDEGTSTPSTDDMNTEAADSP